MIGTSIDPHIDAVLRRLPSDVSVCRIDIDRYPSALGLTLRPGDYPRVQLNDGDASWILDGCKLAWFRRLGQPGLAPELDATYRRFALGEIEQALTGALELLEPQRWFNAYWPTRRAAGKPWQYQTIVSLGIPFSDTLITNRAIEARTWAADNGDVIYKTLHSPVIADPGDKARSFAFSSRLTASDLDDNAAISQCPCQFQRFIDTAFEIRITSIGERHFAVRIDHPKWVPGEPVDWRAHHGRLRYSVYTLPASIEEQLNALLGALDLQFGASDWIVTENDEHVLLEINPHGAWLWLEEQIDIPITEAIAAHLRDQIACTPHMPP